MTWKTLKLPEPVPPEQDRRRADQPLPVDPGHVRTLAHYNAMLAELNVELKKPGCNRASEKQ